MTREIQYPAKIIALVTSSDSYTSDNNDSDCRPEEESFAGITPTDEMRRARDLI